MQARVSMIGESPAGCGGVCKTGSVRRGRGASSAHSCAAEMSAAAATASMAAATTATGTAAGMSASGAAGRDACRTCGTGAACGKHRSCDGQRNGNSDQRSGNDELG